MIDFFSDKVFCNNMNILHKKSWLFTELQCALKWPNEQMMVYFKLMMVKCLFHDGEMLVNYGEMLVNDGKMRIGSSTPFTIIE